MSTQKINKLQNINDSLLTRQLYELSQTYLDLFLYENAVFYAEKLYCELQKVIGVINIHDIHIWCISIGRPSISLHILSNSPQKTLEQATLVCQKFGIHHCSIQVEDNTQIKRLSYVHCNHQSDNDIH